MEPKNPLVLVLVVVLVPKILVELVVGAPKRPVDLLGVLNPNGVVVD